MLPSSLDVMKSVARHRGDVARTLFGNCLDRTNRVDGAADAITLASIISNQKTPSMAGDCSCCEGSWELHPMQPELHDDGREARLHTTVR